MVKCFNCRFPVRFYSTVSRSICNSKNALYGAYSSSGDKVRYRYCFCIHLLMLSILGCRFGPLVRHWTMRYEAKHNYLKKMGQNVGNYINISWTLAMSHQYLQCYNSISGDNLFETKPEIGPGIYYITYNMYYYIYNMCIGDLVASRDRPVELIQEAVSGDTPYIPLHYRHCHYSLCRPNWVKVDGISYQKPCALLIGFENDYPLFARVEDNIFIINDRIMFNVTTLETLCFNDHLQAYTIKPTSHSKLILQSKLVYPSPMHIHRVAHNTTQSVIVCKHHICHMMSH